LQRAGAPTRRASEDAGEDKDAGGAMFVSLNTPWLRQLFRPLEQKYNLWWYRTLDDKRGDCDALSSWVMRRLLAPPLPSATTCQRIGAESAWRQLPAGTAVSATALHTRRRRSPTVNDDNQTAAQPDAASESGEPAGVVQLPPDDDDIWEEAPADAAAPPAVENVGNGWNARGILLGLLALAIIIGGLLFIYWGAFHIV
jgi:hypothetical protein